MNNTAFIFWEKYPGIRSDLGEVHELMQDAIRVRDEDTEEVLHDMIDSGGKLLRPAFLLLSGKFGKYNKKKLASLAAVIELLHMSTLVHDDIIDDAPLRRGKQTVQAAKGKTNAVLLGDFLFARCFMLLSEKTSMTFMRMVAKVISQICLGEMEQFSSKYQQDVSPRRYLKRISAKTAALFSLSCYIGAIESKCKPKLISTLSKIGYNTGMAFQIIDDILDYSGNAQLVGKAVGHDLEQGIFTIPLIYALKTDKNGELTKLLAKAAYSKEDVGEIIRLTRESGGVARAQALAEKYSKKAFKYIDMLPEKDEKNIIRELVEKLLIREY